MNNCIFCQIISKKINAHQLIENKDALAFLDHKPAAPGHALIVPKKHFNCFSLTPTNIMTGVFELMHELANEYKKKFPEIIGFNYISNENAAAGQVIFHTHFHLIPKYNKDYGINVDKCLIIKKTSTTEFYNKFKLK